MSENIGKWARKLDLAFNDIWVLRFATVGALCVAVLFLLPASSPACRCGVVGVHGSRYGFDRALRLFAAAALRTMEEAADRQTAGSPLEPLEQCGVRRFFRCFARSGIVPYFR